VAAIILAVIWIGTGVVDLVSPQYSGNNSPSASNCNPSGD
jgi:hypothetical protein